MDFHPWVWPRVTPAAVTAHVEVRAVQGHPQACMGILFGPSGVDEPRMEGPCAGCVQEVGQGLTPPRVVCTPLFPAAIMKVLFRAQVEILSHRRWPGVVVVREGVGWPMVSVPGCHIWHREPARVPVPSRAVRSVTVLDGGYWSWS